MNALVAKLDAVAWPSRIVDERQELPGFWTFGIQGTGLRCSAHRLGTAVIGGQTLRLWLAHAPRAVLRALRDQDGIYVRTLKEIASSGQADDIAARLGHKAWLVDGTYTGPQGGIAVTGFPWTFTGAVATGTDGLMVTSALVRPRTGVEALGDVEDYDGAEATL